jgi:hypothetical protein
MSAPCNLSSMLVNDFVESLQSPAFTHSSTGPVIHLFASRHDGPGFNPQRGSYVKPGFSC